MNPQRRRRPTLWLAGLALGTFLALLIAPQTRWLVRVQWAASMGVYHPFPGCAPNINSYSLSLRTDREREAVVAARHPKDFPIQLAYPSEVLSFSTERLARLRSMKAYFPSNPSLDATALRYASLNAVRLHRRESYLLAGEPIPKEPMDIMPPTVEQLALFDRDAADGERLEPDNAYFPLMRAVGLFAAHRDAEAIAAVRRAGAKTRWDEHLLDEPTGEWRLHAEAFGDPNALWRAQAMGNVLLPELSALRAVARVATYRAVLDEHAGRTQDGFAIRRALMRCGGLMRAQSSFVVGTIVGMATTKIAMARPGGIPASRWRPAPAGAQEEFSRRNTDTYIAYLNKIGQKDEARWVQAEAQATKQTQAIVTDPFAWSRNSPLSKPTLTLAALWVIALLIISNILWTLAFGGIATLLRRKDKTAPVEPSPSGSGTALVWTILALPTLLLALVALVTSEWIITASNFLSTALPLLLLAAIVITIVYLVRIAFTGKVNREAIARRLRGALLTLALLLLSTGMLINASRWQTLNAFSVIEIERSFQVLVQDDNSQFTESGWVSIVCMAASLALPTLIVLASIGIGLARRVAFRESVRSIFRSTALPAAAILLIVYGGLTLATLRQERAVNVALTRSLSHEGRYWAELTGRTWPGVTEEVSLPR